MKKTLSLTLAATLVIGSLAGCSSAPSSGSEGSAATAETTTASDTGEVTLQLLQFKEDQAAIIQAMVEDYNALGNGVKVEATILGDDYNATRQSRFAANNGPDIFFVEGYSDAQTWLEYLEDLSDEPWVSHLAEGTVDGVTFDGKIYGFPIGLEGYGFVYNKDLFAQAGITEEPKTISELREVDEKLKAAGIQSTCDAMSEWWFTGQHLVSLPFAAVEDPEAFAASITAGEAKIADNPYMQGFFDIMDLMVEYGAGTDSIGVDYNASLAKFAAGETAMMMTGNWAEASITAANADINLGVFPVPLSDDPDDAKMATNVSAYYVVNSQSEHVQEAKDFLNWMYENYQTYFIDQLGLIPAFTDKSDTSSLGMTGQAISTSVESGETVPFAFFFWPSGVKEEFYVPLQQYAAGLMDRDETMAEMQNIWDKYAGN